MRSLDLKKIDEYIIQRMEEFHRKRLEQVTLASLDYILPRKNPYLFKAKNTTSAEEFVKAILDAYLSSSEETTFGKLLQDIAVFISQMTCGGQLATGLGLDLDFSDEGIRYLVSIKSGPNWGNNSQKSDLKTKFKAAIRTVRQSDPKANIRAVLGICYGAAKTVDRGDYVEIIGKDFWEFISGDNNLYIHLIEPISHNAQQHNEIYISARNQIYDRFIRDFKNEFCDASGKIDWIKLIAVGEDVVVTKSLSGKKGKTIKTWKYDLIVDKILNMLEVMHEIRTEILISDLSEIGNQLNVRQQDLKAVLNDLEATTIIEKLKRPERYRLVSPK